MHRRAAEATRERRNLTKMVANDTTDHMPLSLPKKLDLNLPCRRRGALMCNPYK